MAPQSHSPTPESPEESPKPSGRADHAGLTRAQQAHLLSAIAAQATLPQLLADASFWAQSEADEHLGQDTDSLRAAISSHLEEGGTIESLVPHLYAPTIAAAVAKTLRVAGLLYGADVDLELGELVEAASIKIWQVMCRLREGRVVVREGGSLGGLVCAVAVNHTRDTIRRVHLKRRHQISLEGIMAASNEPDADPLEFLEAGASPSAERLALEAEFYTELRALIGEEAFGLLHIRASGGGRHALTHADLAAWLGISYRSSTPRTRLSRACQALRVSPHARHFRSDWAGGIE